MPNEVYEVVAQAARYWFLFLMVLIVWRSWRWLGRDRKQRRKRLRLLPDAGYVGELVVQTGNAELPAGVALPVAREGVLGSVRGADVYAPVGGIAKKHLWFEYDEENGLYVEPYGHHSADADGQPLLGWHTHAYLVHGSRLTVGDAVLRLRMFAGFEHAGVTGANSLPFDGEGPAQAVMPTPEQAAALQAQAWAAWMAAQGIAPEQIAAMQLGARPATPAQIAALAQAYAAAQATQGNPAAQAGALTPAQWQAFAAAQGNPAAQAGALTPAQWQAFAAAQGNPAAQAGALTPAQWQAFAAAQGNPAAQAGEFTPAQWQAFAAAQGNPAAQAQGNPATQQVLTTPTGAFVPPPRVLYAKPAPILSAEDVPPEDTDAAFETPPPPRRYRGVPLPPLSEADETAAWAAGEPPAHAAAATDDAAPYDAAEGAQANAHTVPWPAPETYATFAPQNAQPDATFAPRVTFYPPLMDDQPGAPVEGGWPSADEPPHGATAPMAPDEPYEYADEDEAPRSLYVEPDEAERAKRLLWDRYLKGGNR
jgi:hypothetical protein